MNISLTPEVEQTVREVIASGLAPDAESFIEDAITRTAANYKQRLEKLREAVAIGVEQADRGEFSNRTVEDIIADANARKHSP